MYRFPERSAAKSKDVLGVRDIGFSDMALQKIVGNLARAERSSPLLRSA